jgi:hypothetical protein
MKHSFSKGSSLVTFGLVVVVLLVLLAAVGCEPGSVRFVPNTEITYLYDHSAKVCFYRPGLEAPRPIACTPEIIKQATTGKYPRN